MNEAEKIYRAHKEEFLRIYEITQMHKELRHISPTYLPDENMAFNEQYGRMTSASKTSYLYILRLMEKSKATRTRIERFQSAQGGNVEFVRISIFSRGIGGDTEGIWVEHYTGPEPVSNFRGDHELCRALDEPGWSLCHSW